MLRLSDRQEIPSTLRNPTVITHVHFRNMPLIRTWISFLQAFREKASFPFLTSHAGASIRLPQQCLTSIARLTLFSNCRREGGIWPLRTVCSQTPHLTTDTYVTSVHCDVTSVHCDVTSVHCDVTSVHCGVTSVHYYATSVQCDVTSSQCDVTVSNVTSPVSNVTL